MKTLETYLTCHEGNLGLNVPDGVLPGFLIDAYNLATTGCRDQAAELLDKENVDCVRELQQGGSDVINLVMLILAMTLQRTGDSTAAAHWYEQILHDEENPIVLNELAELHQASGHFSQAIPYRERALAVDPGNMGIVGNYAVDLMAAGHLEKGIDMMRVAVADGTASAQLHSKYLFFLHYLPSMTQAQLLAAHREWGRRHAPTTRALQSHGNGVDPDRRLRIGYVSADFRRHSAAYNMEALLEGHSAEIVEVFGYGNIAQPDDVTERMAGKFDHYRSIVGMDDVTAARLIERDEIDILVALAGHTTGHRLDVFARRPAPVQVEYQGINTTGMAQVDYRLTDELLDPPNSAAGYVEELCYLRGGWFCYRPPEFAPPVGPLPARVRGHVTFGAFHGSLKVNREVVSLWAEVLMDVPRSRLIMKCPGGTDPVLRKRYADWFEACGFDANRLEILGWLSPEAHLALYNRVDIALDAFPFNGAVNTLEGMWMGVPTISLAGETCVSRTGLMLLTRVGLGYFVCRSREEYVAKAVTLARQSDSLARIRATLRERVTASSLCDKRQRAAELEEAYRTIWRRWCDAQPQSRRVSL